MSSKLHSYLLPTYEKYIFYSCRQDLSIYSGRTMEFFWFLQMTVTWTSGYDINEAVPFLEWGLKGETQTKSPAGTLTFSRNSMCGTLINSSKSWVYIAPSRLITHCCFLKQQNTSYQLKLSRPYSFSLN